MCVRVRVRVRVRVHVSVCVSVWVRVRVCMCVLSFLSVMNKSKLSVAVNVQSGTHRACAQTLRNQTCGP